MAEEPSADGNRSEESHSSDRFRTSFDDLLRCVDAFPTIGSQTADEILGYDENGLPH